MTTTKLREVAKQILLEAKNCGPEDPDSLTLTEIGYAFDDLADMIATWMSMLTFALEEDDDADTD